MSAYVYAAYNAAPPELARNAAQERDWYSLLRGETLIRGLELSYKGGLHPRGVGHLAALLRPGWQNVVTNIPGTIACVAADATYGLASTTERGRASAIEHVRELHAQVRALQAVLGEEAVIAVELHSAPVAAAGASSVEGLALSLTEIASWEWGGVRLIVEHADALVETHAPQKGWLGLDAEREAVALASERSGREMRQGLNWGRSAIETRSSEGALGHIEKLASAGTLGAFVVSGASASATARSEPWGDVHLALDTFGPESLLTREVLRMALAALDGVELDFIGVKVGTAADATTLAERLAPGLGTLRELERVRAGR
jgi:hypothetical protein